MFAILRQSRKFSAQILLIGLILAPLFILTSPVLAANYSLDGVDAFDDGTFIDTELLHEGKGLRITSDGEWGALTWRTPDKTLTVGSAFTTDGTDIYVVRGNGDVVFWKYSPTTDSWEDLATLP